MSAVGMPRRTRPAAIRRRRLAALAAIALAAAAVGLAVGRSGGGNATKTGAPSRPAIVAIELGGVTVARSNADALRGAAARSRILAVLPAHRVAHQSKATITYAVEREAAVPVLRQALRVGGGKVAVPERPIAAHIKVPLTRQRLQDDCEATALSMVLGYAGPPVGQLTLQRQVAAAKPLDPQVGPQGEEIWGDPSLGFVGRADGGGPGGGFGVYQGPIEALAARHGLTMSNLTGEPPRRLYAELLAGRPLLVWVALSEGPLASWTSPAGRPIEVNYGEHAIVLTGVTADSVHLNDPLSGRRLTWPKAKFERMWAGLGRRALAA
jgi:uncharacterized protein YvpB